MRALGRTCGDHQAALRRAGGEANGAVPRVIDQRDMGRADAAMAAAEAAGVVGQAALGGPFAGQYQHGYVDGAAAAADVEPPAGKVADRQLLHRENACHGFGWMSTRCRVAPAAT